ncbi:unnamed protein product, partial [Mesorhabditis belari]|uniref:COMM domain-containing protein n=1 Tax=Mesorhabditis belari TaxID=2138241 RepID=A0AAF3EAM7_9BILA
MHRLLKEQLQQLSDLSRNENLDQEKLEILVQILLGERKWDKPCSFSLAETVWRIYSIAAGIQLTAEEFRSHSQLLKSPCSTILSDVYENHSKQIRACLSTIRIRNPEVLDVRWKEQLNSNAAASVAFELQTLPVDTLATGLVRFECDRNQLLELHHRLKEAQNFLEILNSNCK